MDLYIHEEHWHIAIVTISSVSEERIDQIGSENPNSIKADEGKWNWIAADTKQITFAARTL